MGFQRNGEELKRRSVDGAQTARMSHKRRGTRLPSQGVHLYERLQVTACEHGLEAGTSFDCQGLINWRLFHATDGASHSCQASEMSKPGTCQDSARRLNGSQAEARNRRRLASAADHITSNVTARSKSRVEAFEFLRIRVPENVQRSATRCLINRDSSKGH